MNASARRKGRDLASIYDFTAKDIKGDDVALSDYRGKVLLIVNTASKCGFTPQYEGLETLYQDLQDKGLVVLGFPCNQFGNQEPGDAEEIANFCKLTYDVNFPMFAKIDVNGEDAAPLYEFLKREATGLMGSKAIKWNFTKFLVDREGNVVKRFGPQETPEKLRGAVEALL
ncbi:MAG: glutathione peroxidase [Pseudomonadota bacterium]|nr:glutathione peroxidase [Pseudomonadota bacterium]